MSEKWTQTARSAATAVKRAAEATANGVHAVTGYVARHDGTVADGVQSVTRIVGAGLDRGGTALSASGKRVGSILHGKASVLADAAQRSVVGAGPTNGWLSLAGMATWGATKVVAHTAGLAANVATLAGQTAALAGRYTEKSAPGLAGTAGGVTRGACEFTSNALDSVALSSSSIETMRQELRILGQAEVDRSTTLMQTIDSARKRNRKAELLDLLVVGGMTLAQALRDPGSVPPAIEEAFALAYPGLATSQTFTDAVHRMSSEELVGLVSGVKGKLFELELVDHLNHGGLPDGFHADLAPSATQGGWDIVVKDSHGHVNELLQAKANQSAHYVEEALQRYPNIDVTSTSEVHAHLVALGLAQNVHDSAISDAALQAKVDAAVNAGADFSSSLLPIPSSIGLAIIALSVFMDKGKTLREMGAEFGSRSAKAGASSALGKLAMVATQTWWLGLVAGVGSRWLATHGDAKRAQYEALRHALNVLRKAKTNPLVQKRLGYTA